MMKATLKIFTLVLCAGILTLGLVVYTPHSSVAGLINQYEEPEEDTIVIKRSDGDELVFEVEMAITSHQQAQGLMNRTYLAENAGMMFLFEDDGHRVFWMKNTLIPLDMFFIAKDGEILHIHHMAKPLDEARITSVKPAMAVLELNGGAADDMNIKVGDKIYHAAFRNTHMVMPPPVSMNPSVESLLAE